MIVITFVSQKGGVSKSTLSINCAVAAESAKRRTLLIDLDPQGTAEQWYQEREVDTPRLVKIPAAALDKAIQTARQQGFQTVLIDTPGRDEPVTAAAIRTADFCVIPCRPTAADMKATPPTVNTLKRLQKPFAFVLTQTPPRGFRIREADQALSVLGIVAPVPIVHRTTYQDAFTVGQSVTEFEPEGKAAAEITQLWQWITTKADKLTS